MFPRQQQQPSRSVFILRERLPESPPVSPQCFHGEYPYSRKTCLLKLLQEWKMYTSWRSVVQFTRGANIALNTNIMCRQWKTPSSIFFCCSYLADLYSFERFNICSSSTRGAHDGSSLPSQYSSVSDPSPNVPTENSPALSFALGWTPASGRVQTWLFSNIIRKEIALLFFFANGLQPCVSCIPSRTNYAQQEKERKTMWAMGEHIGQ